MGPTPNRPARFREAGHLVPTQKRKNCSDMTGKINRWKTILNTLHVHYRDRIEAALNQ